MAGSTFAARSYRDLAIVLRTQKLGEADRIITVLTSFHGLVRAVAKGVRRTQSKFGATLEPFMVADVQFVHGRSLDIVTQAASRSTYGAMIAADYEKYTAASAMAEAAERIAEHDADAPASGANGDPRRHSTGSSPQFDLLHGALSALARGVHTPDLVLSSYLLRALGSAGWAVTWSACAACGEPGAHTGFHPGTGGPVCGDCRPPGTRTLSAGTAQLLHALQHGQWSQAAESSTGLRHEAVAVATDYAQHHLERRLTSLRLAQ